MYYDIKQNCKLCCFDSIPNKNFISFLSMSDKEKLKETNIKLFKIVEIYKELPYTRAEFSDDILYGSIFIPALLNHEEIHIIFLLEKDSIYFVSDSKVAEKELKDTIQFRHNNITDASIMLYYFFEQLIDDDLEKIDVIQDHLSKLESQIFKEPDENYSKRLTDFRRKTLQISHYYMQFAALTSLFSENTFNIFSKKQQQLFSSLSNRIIFLKEEADQLWDYILQVREIYQEQMDVRLNEIMKFFTMVTTLCLPLSLIATWYGMNFKYMPELEGKYSYFIVISISIVIVIASCIWFKKKKFW